MQGSINHCQRGPVFFLLALSLSLAALSPVLGQSQKLHTLNISNAQELHQFFRYTDNDIPLISGHRGGMVEGFPENCIPSFENTLRHTPAFFEIDPRLTKDGVIVLMHDATLERTTNGSGKVSDYTWEELRKLRLKDKEGNLTKYHIPTLAETIEWAKGKTIINLDKKDVPLKMTADILEKHHAVNYVMVTVHSAEEALYYYRRNPDRMFSAFIRNPEEFKSYEKAGIPWENIMAYIGPKNSPEAHEMLELLHAKGVKCMISAAPSYDKLPKPAERAKAYREIIEDGTDVIESDLPIEAAKAIQDLHPEEAANRRFFTQTALEPTSYHLPLAEDKTTATSKVTASTLPGDSLAAWAYTELPLGAVKPEGWLRDQLEIMRDGTTGHLDEVHDKIKNDNGWLGGQGDGWEETPYWLDGAVPLAWLLNDARLKKKVLQYINWTLDHQRSSGYFGPITKAEREKGIEITPDNCSAGEDWWPKMIMLKVLKQYYTATDDPRVIPFMSKYFRYQLQALKSCPIGNWTEWAQSRGTDNVMMAQWLYDITGEEYLIELASLVESQSFQWSKWLGNRDWVIDAAVQQNDENWMHRHAVNVGMALKSPAVNYRRTHDKAYLSALKTGFNDLMTLHGLPMGVFSGDEDLHGNAPTQGTELCAITESMFSLEKIIAVTGDVYYMDALERMTFNALPAQTTDDYNMKQYFQIANQVQVSRGVFDFSLPFNREMNNVFGMRSGYTCCLANMHQGWTKFTTHLWSARPGHGLAALSYAPSTLTAKVGADATEITIKEKTSYPFGDRIDFEIAAGKAVSFPFDLRIPSWCSEARITLNGKELRKAKGGQVITLERRWENGDLLSLELPMQVMTSNWGKNSRTIERGPLVYALKLEEKWVKGHDEVEGDYFSVYPMDDWNYGLLEQVVKAPVDHTEVQIQPVSGDFIWNLKHAPIAITAAAKKIPGWKAVNGVAHQPVTARNGIYKGEVSDTVETVTLVPYGCTKVRIVAFPVVE